jgi:hypothetical protein
VDGRAGWLNLGKNYLSSEVACTVGVAGSHKHSYKVLKLGSTPRPCTIPFLLNHEGFRRSNRLGSVVAQPRCSGVPWLRGRSLTRQGTVKAVMGAVRLDRGASPPPYPHTPLAHLVRASL